MAMPQRLITGDILQSTILPEQAPAWDHGAEELEE